MPPDPPSKRGLAAPCQYRRLLFSNWLPTSNFIETPEYMKMSNNPAKYEVLIKQYLRSILDIRENFNYTLNVSLLNR